MISPWLYLAAYAVCAAIAVSEEDTSIRVIAGIGAVCWLAAGVLDVMNEG